MALNINETFIGAPVQEVSGAVQTAPVGTAGPNDALSQLSGAWKDSGYVDENGVSFSQDRSTTSIKEWSGATIRTLLDEFNGTVSYTEAQTNYETMCRMVGASNVTKVDATADHGTQLKVQIGAEMPPALAWVFSMADKRTDDVIGRMRLYMPSGQVTSVDSVSFVSDDIVKWSFTITANKTADEAPIVLFTDDGEKLAPSPTVVPDISLNHSNIELGASGTANLFATVAPADAEITWASSDELVATVDEYGLVTAVGAGSATVSATITVDDEDYSDSCAVTVTA